MVLALLTTTTMARHVAIIMKKRNNKILVLLGSGRGRGISISSSSSSTFSRRRNNLSSSSGGAAGVTGVGVGSKTATSTLLQALTKTTATKTSTSTSSSCRRWRELVIIGTRGYSSSSSMSRTSSSSAAAAADGNSNSLCHDSTSTTTTRYYSSSALAASAPTASYPGNNNNNNSGGSQSQHLLGLGSYKWNLMEPDLYKEIIKTALLNGVTTVEAGQGDGAERALADALKSILSENPELLASSQTKIQVLFRLGYRTIQPPSSGQDDDGKGNGNGEATTTTTTASSTVSLPGDVIVEEQPVNAPPPPAGAAAGGENPVDFDDMDTSAIDIEADGETVNKEAGFSRYTIKVVHNIGPDYIQMALMPDNNPLVQLRNQYPNLIQLCPLINNPEVQGLIETGEGSSSGSSASAQQYISDQRQVRIQNHLTEAFRALEDQVLYGGDGLITSYGIASNGICLPPDHPMYLKPTTVLNSARDTLMMSNMAQQNNNNKRQSLAFNIVQLPINVLETTGIQIAKEIKRLSDGGGYYETPIQIYAMRPLSCYPDRGTGQHGYPVVLADHKLPATMEKQLEYTNAMQRPPEVYDIALKTAMSHFDAEELLQLKVEGQQLSTAQRETLDGCKLLQSLLHDLDRDISSDGGSNKNKPMISYAAYENELYTRIIPLIHDTFEAYDDDTAHVLQSFFGAYALAVKYAIARNTRKLLHGETKLAIGDDGNDQQQPHSSSSWITTIPKFSEDELPQSTRLQEFALQHLLKQHADIIDKVMVGMSQPDQVLDNVQIVNTIVSEVKQQQKEGGSQE